MYALAHKGNLAFKLGPNRYGDNNIKDDLDRSATWLLIEIKLRFKKIEVA